MEKRWVKGLMVALSYILVAALACLVTIILVLPTMKYYNSYVPMREPEGELKQNAEKLEELLSLIEAGHIVDSDLTELTDAAAAAMLAATGDPWSSYIPASKMVSHDEREENAYAGIGIAINTEDISKGFLISHVEPGGSAHKAGILAGDLIISVQGQNLVGKDIAFARGLIRGEAGTEVTVTVLRDGQTLEFTMERMQILQPVVMGMLLEGKVGYIIITNFYSRCADETIACIEDLVAKGATSLLFDVRFNGGGYKSELVDLLDYLLPEGEMFRSEDYTGTVEVDTSNASCLRMPMAVLINQYSYSAAEFFAAVLQEYEWAFTVGEKTVGKGFYQVTIPMSDGSAVALSIGKYYTPKGVSLAEVGGLTPTIEVEVGEETQVLIYSGLLDPMEDPQVLAALDALKERKSGQ